MTILEAENQTLRRRLRDIETELREFKATYARVVEDNAQLKDRIKVLERQLQPGLDGRIHERVDATFRVDGVNSRGEAAMGVVRNVSIGGALIETDLRLMPGERMTITFALLDTLSRCRQKSCGGWRPALGCGLTLMPKDRLCSARCSPVCEPEAVWKSEISTLQLWDSQTSDSSAHWGL